MKIGQYLLAGVLIAGGLAHAKHWHEGGDRRGDDCYFNQKDHRVIVDYYGPRAQRLPPGLQKKLYRTGHLPPGWERKMEPLPIAVERQLSPPPAGCRRGFMDGFVVVYNPGSQVVVDIVAAFGR